jgi:polysaccharide deacetylase family protein (PEP-CTERM system associated)
MNAPSFHPAALSFDIEDWFHPELVRGRVDRGERRSVVHEGTTALLELLARHQVRSTFFLLGDVVRSHPSLVRSIAAAGHELACHGMSHRPLWALEPASFREELRAFRAALRDAVGSDAAIGYRAPTFSLDRSTAWAIDVLAEEGFHYDSSVFPMRVRLYGVAGAPRGVYRPSSTDPGRPDAHGRIVEFPVAVGSLGPFSVPVAGGFYLRALPIGVLTSVLDGVARLRPFALYLHPWECVRDLPRVPLSPGDAFITYTGLSGVMRKLEALIARYPFTTMSDILERAGAFGPAA